MAQSTRVSSMGSKNEPYRLIPALSPSACLIAVPSTIPVSSTVWCPSTSKSPFTLHFKSKKPCLEKPSSIWSKKPMPVSISLLPKPSIFKITEMSVSFVLRSTVVLLAINFHSFYSNLTLMEFSWAVSPSFLANSSISL